VRHARPADLAPLEPTLAQLRSFDALVERKPGTFYKKSSAFLHFHIDGSDFYADVKLNGVEFERVRATTKAEQRALVGAVRRSLAG
jgi:hypothetical protein